MRNPSWMLGLLCALASPAGHSLSAQAADPPYLSQFPTVARVKQAMQAADPRETALKQMGAFWQLQEIIKALSGSREFRGLTPDEARIVQSYYEAHYYVGRAIDSAYPGPYGRWQKVSDNTPYRYSRTDSRFGIEGIDVFTSLLSPAIQSQFNQVIGAEKARFAARARADTDNMMRARADQEAAQQEQAGKGEDERRIRRCVESGRSQVQCVMEGLGKGLMDMASAVVPGIKPAPIYGIRMGGVFPGVAQFGLTFYNEGVTLTCADLVPASKEYTTAITPGGVRVTVASEPGPLVFLMQADGRLSGPAAADITGQVQVGVQEGTRTWSDGRTEPISRPVYETRTRRCGIGVLRASGPSPAIGSLKTAPGAILNTVLGSPDPDANKATPAGLRMSGEYGTPDGLDIEFKPEGAVVGCRDAVALRPYTVQMQGGQAVVRVDNAGVPFGLVIGADGRLSGSGMIRVDGRVVTGTTPSGEIAYAARTLSCNLGTLGPTAQPMSQAEAGAAAARASLGQPAHPAPAEPAASAAPAGKAVLSLESGFPAPAGTPSLLAGRPFLLLDAPIDDLIRQAGITPPAGSSPLAAMNLACSNGAPQCQAAMQAITAHTRAILKPDQNGLAESSEVEPRTYYLMGSAIDGGTARLWNMPVALKAGKNRLILDARNANPVP